MINDIITIPINDNNVADLVLLLVSVLPRIDKPWNGSETLKLFP
jgi:hypothetical protein